MSEPSSEAQAFASRRRRSSFDAIIANGNLEGSGRVTVNMGEIFKSAGCQDWKKAG